METQHFTESASESSASYQNTIQKHDSKRKANVYDTVAGRVTQAGFIGRFKDTRGSKQSLRPDEVLFKQVNAPIRYEEADYYRAHAGLPVGQHLPTCELLTALHAYISKLYSREVAPNAPVAWKCMDETALIALGVLIDETAKEVLGKTGDLALTEAADRGEEEAALGTRNEERQVQLSRNSGANTRVVGQAWSSSDDGSQYAMGESDSDQE